MLSLILDRSSPGRSSVALDSTQLFFNRPVSLHVFATMSEHSSSTFLNNENRAAAVKLCFYTIFTGPSRLGEKWPLCCVYISKSAECQELTHGQERWCLQAESLLRNRNIVARFYIQLATSCPPAESDDSAACAKNCSQNCKLWNSRTISYSARLCKIRILHPKIPQACHGLEAEDCMKSPMTCSGIAVLISPCHPRVEEHSIDLKQSPQSDTMSTIVLAEIPIEICAFR